jgi:competence ComEA-like helix-hairpin-helix protein
MRTIRRSVAPFALAACSLATLVAPAPLRAADHPEKQIQRTPAHEDGANAQNGKDHPVRVRPGAHHASDKHDTDKVNINTAEVKELMTLTGVGRKVAEKIVEYRDTHGPFKKADELRKVDGVGNGLWEKNRDRVVTK